MKSFLLFILAAFPAVAANSPKVDELAKIGRAHV